VDHHHWHVAVTTLRHHEPHVHLVDGDVTVRTQTTVLQPRLRDRLAANEESCFVP
jgi:hypothetical protein